MDIPKSDHSGGHLFYIQYFQVLPLLTLPAILTIMKCDNYFAPITIVISIPPPWRDTLAMFEATVAGGREFEPRPGQYSRMSFSSDQVTGTVFPHLKIPFLPNSEFI